MALVWIVTVVGIVAGTWTVFFMLILAVIALLDAAGVLPAPSNETTLVAATAVWTVWAIGCTLYFGQLWLTMRREEREPVDSRSY